MCIRDRPGTVIDLYFYPAAVSWDDGGMAGGFVNGSTDIVFGSVFYQESRFRGLKLRFGVLFFDSFWNKRLTRFRDGFILTKEKGRN